MPVYDIIIDYIKKKKHIYVDPTPNVKVLDAKYTHPLEAFGKGTVRRIRA